MSVTIGKCGSEASRIICPDTRAVCNAKDGSLSRIQNISTLWLDKEADEMKGSSECRDTEPMKAGLNEVNNVEIGEGNRRLVLSMDIENMYPSLDKETVKKEISIVIKNYSTEISNINWKTLCLFLLHKTDKTTIRKAGLSRLMPIKKAGTKEFHEV